MTKPITQSPSEKQSNKAKKTLEYLKFSGLAFQLFAWIGLAVWGGYEVDMYFDSLPIFTLLFAMLALFIGLYFIIKTTSKA